jgi:uncharacterized lipoprotein YehR (DUF1307 family)
MKKVFLIISLVLVVMLSSCTKNSRAKNFGGTMKIDLPIGKKLITVTWKNDDMWYLTRTMRNDETPETYEFKENSNLGIMEGTVIFIEHRK